MRYQQARHQWLSRRNAAIILHPKRWHVVQGCWAFEYDTGSSSIWRRQLQHQRHLYWWHLPDGDDTQYSANKSIPAGQFIKMPMRYLSICDIEPYYFSAGVFKELPDKYESTVGQIQMLRPTCNYSYVANEGGYRSPHRHCKELSFDVIQLYHTGLIIWWNCQVIC